MYSFNYPPAVAHLVNAVRSEISKSDGMFAGSEQLYFECGASALNCLQAMVALAAVPTPNRILDFGAGAGRVTRWLRAAYPAAELHACELGSRDGDLRFLAEKMGAITFASSIDVRALSAPATYDLIWVGSVFTHLAAESCERLFTKLTSWLNPNGLLVFSLHGRRAIHYDAKDNSCYGLTGDQRRKALTEYRTSGFGYSDYVGQAGYGISFSTSEWWVRLVEKAPGMRLIAISEAAFDKHQDVVAVQRASIAQ